MEKALILSTAFRVWGEEMFMKTSLSSLARSLGISKTALYRYFPAKDVLMEAMIEHYIQNYRAFSVKALPALEKGPLRSSLCRYAEMLLEFYADHDGFFYFFARFIFQRSHRFRNRLLAEIIKEAEVIRRRLDEESDVPTASIELLVKVIYTQLFFWCELATGSERNAYPDGISGAVRDMVNSLFLGFFPDEQMAKFDPEAIEKKIVLDPAEMPEVDKRFEAILNVIAREGFARASVSKIADELNISKSSLYSFFENKNDMLGKVKDAFIAWHDRVACEKFRDFDRDIDKLYAHVYLILLIMVTDKKIGEFLNWMRFQSIYPEKGKADINFRAHALVREILEKPGVNTHGLDADQFEGCFRVQLVMEIMESIYRKSGIRKTRANIRDVFRILVFGINKYCCNEGEIK